MNYNLDSISAQIIFRDHHFILANKPAGIPVQDDKTGDTSLIAMLQAYCKHDLYLVHRIDRPVSGLVLFAKTKEAQTEMTSQMSSKQFQKTYLAIVEKKEIPEEGVWTDELMHDKKNKKSHVAEPMTGTKKAVMKYSFYKDYDRFRILEIQTETGRFHQIRSQLSHRGFPIKGDVKYGYKRGHKDRSIGLHAWKIEWYNKYSQKNMVFKIEPPENESWKSFQ